MNKRKFFSIVTTLTIVLSLVLFAVVLVKGQEVVERVLELYEFTHLLKKLLSLRWQNRDHGV